MAAANNTLIGAVRAEATLESGKFVDGAKKIRKEAKETEVQLKSSFSGMGAAVKGFGTALTAGLSVGLLSSMIKKSLDFATSIKDVAAQVGVSTKELQQFRYAASQVGIAQADADKGLEKFNLTLSKAEAGSKTAKAALAAVGVTLEDIRNKSRTELFGQIADQMNKQGGAAKNAAAANAIFGDSAAKMFPLLNKGSQGVNELAAAAERLGIVLSDRQIQQADETARKLDDVRQVLAAEIAGTVADNAQSIVTMAQALGSLTSEIIKFLNSNPQLALAIIGGLLGGRVGGLPGAGVGAVAGYVAGDKLAQTRDDNNMDLAFRKQQAVNALREVRARQQSGGGLVTFRRGDAKRSGGTLESAEAEYKRQIGLYANARRAARNPAVVAPPGTMPQFLAPAGPKPRRAPRAPRDRSDDVRFQFDQELRRAHSDVLRAQLSLAKTSDDRARLALELLDAERGMQEAELNNRVRRAERDFAEGKITEAALDQVKVQADKLRAEYNDRDALERKAIADDLAAEKARDAAQLVQSDYDLRIELLQTEATLAKTAKGRRDVELRILDLMKQQERARLDAIIADKDSSELAKEEARRRRDALDQIYEGREKVTKDGTKGPLEGYFDTLPTDADKMNEALENVAANGLKSLEDGILDVITGTKSLKEAFHDMAQQILAELLRIAIQKYIIGTIMKVTGLDSGGFANGGEVGSYAYGGFVSGPGGPKEDRIPAMLSAGEFVINAKSTKQFLPLLKRINDGDFSRLAMGGLSLPRPSFADRSGVSNDNAPGMPAMSFTFNNDFRGSDPASVAAIKARQDRMEAELPARVVQAYQDAKSRFVIRE